MFCKNCGKEIDDKACVCPHCGVGVGNNATVAPDDAPSAGFAVLCFFIPIVGLILYLMWHTTYPQKAKSCGKGAIIGVCVSVGISILSVILVSCATASVINGMYGILLI